MLEKKKKIFGPLEIIVFIAAMLLLVYIGIKSGGGNVFERKETVEITDNPKQSGGEERAKRKLSEKEDESVEMILQQIADQFSKGETDFQAQKKLEKTVMTQDEKDFLEDVKKRKEPEAVSDSVDWFSILRASHKTYTKVKDVFENAGIDVSAAENVTSGLANEAAANALSAKMKEMFNIPEKDTKAFAKKGEKALSDWARFVEEKTQ
jgi:predicted transcriptional regulator